MLEVDPDNTTARRQVGKVVTAVRQFDRTAPGRRWMTGLQKQAGGEGDLAWWPWLLAAMLFLGCVTLSFYWGVQAGRQAVPMMLPAEDGAKKAKSKELKKEDGRKKPPSLGGKQ